jgi:hypothetical protein
MTALEAFARAEAKGIPALAEAIARREEMQRAVDQQGKNVSSRALKRSSKKDNLGNGGKLSTKQNRVYEGRQLVVASAFAPLLLMATLSGASTRSPATRRRAPSVPMHTTSASGRNARPRPQMPSTAPA